MSLFDCPIPSALPTVSSPDDCFASYGNIAKIGIQLYQATPSFDATTIKAVATWTPLIASATATGIRMVDVVNFSTTPGEAITEGGNDATTYKGRPRLRAGGFTTANWICQGISSTIADQVKALSKFAARPNGRTKLRIFLITEDNYAISAADFNGIEAVSLFISDVIKGGSFKPEDTYNGQCYFDYEWSHTMVTTKLNFDHSLLVNP